MIQFLWLRVIFRLSLLLKLELQIYCALSFAFELYRINLIDGPGIGLGFQLVNGYGDSATEVASPSIVITHLDLDGLQLLR